MKPLVELKGLVQSLWLALRPETPQERWNRGALCAMADRAFPDLLPRMEIDIPFERDEHFRAGYQWVMSNPFAWNPPRVPYEIQLQLLKGTREHESQNIQP